MTAPSQLRPHRISAQLVCGGGYHDFDYVRLRLCELLAEDDRLRVRVDSDYESGPRDADLLISYTCDLRPSVRAQQTLSDWIHGGGRWLALHGTNAVIERGGEIVECPPLVPLWAGVVGSRFVAHPPIGPFTVTPAVTGHPVIRGVSEFEVDDELFLLADVADDVQPLLTTRFAGSAAPFAQADWPESTHLVAYERRVGAGAVLYLALGHARGHYDRWPHATWHPTIERGAWESKDYLRLLRQAIEWAAAEPLDLCSPTASNHHTTNQKPGEST